MIVVHGRTRCDMYRNRADWSFIGEVRRAVDVPVIANGDILTVEDAREALRLSDAHGVMVGRGVLRNPWLIRQIADSLAGRAVEEPTLKERRDVLLSYLDALGSLGEHFRGDRARRESVILGRIKKVAGYFTRGLPYGARLRQRIYHSESVPAARHLVVEYFDLLAESRVGDAFLAWHDEEISTG